MKTIFQKSIIIIIGFSLLNGCNSEKKDIQTQRAAIVAPDLTDEATDADNASFEENEGAFITVRGYIDVPPENRVSISPFYGGYVKTIKVLPGTQVNRGDVLFTIQNPFFIEIQQQYLEALEQMSYLREDFERQKVLSGEEIASKKNYAKVESDYKVMKAKATGLKEKLKLLGLPIDKIEKGELYSTVTIYSPTKGNVTAVNIQKGAFLDPKEVAVKIVNIDHLHLELEVFEQDALNIEKGQPISFTIPELSDDEYEGEVYLIVPSIDMTKRTFLVHGHIDAIDQSRLIPGMFVDAKILRGN